MPLAGLQIRAVPSTQAVTTCRPSGENAAMRTMSSWPVERRAARRCPRPRFARSVNGAGHDSPSVGARTRTTVQSQDAPKGQRLTCPLLRPRFARSGHQRRSRHAVRRARKREASTTSLWPARRTICLAVVASQIRAVLSEEPVTMRRPSGENAATGHPRHDLKERRLTCRSPRSRSAQSRPRNSLRFAGRRARMRRW